MFYGSIPALITPFNKGEVDYNSFQKIIEWSIEQGSHGFVPCGTTGESPTLQHEEHKKVVEEVTHADKEMGYPKDNKNGPHTQGYIDSVLDVLHFNTYIDGGDGKMILQMGINGTQPRHIRNCLKEAIQQNNIDINKKDEFLVYQGSHGDKGAEIADIILPGAAYTEKNGLFINLEGSLQRAYKASYPPGDAREDWIIIKELADRMNKPLEYNNIQQLRESIYKEIKSKAVEPAKISKKIDFKEGNISIKTIDYYYTNPIARSSKVMSECRQISKRFLSTGIEKAS